MGNCAGYCNGTTEDDQNQQQIRHSFNKTDLQQKNVHNDFEQKYGRFQMA